MLKDALARAAIYVDQHPERAVVTVAATAELVGETEADVRIGKHLVCVDEPIALGGGGTAPSPEQHALAALGSCVALTYRMWAAQRGIRLDRVSVDVRADLDTRGLLGLAAHVRPGFGDVRVSVHVTGPEPVDRYEELRRLVDAHCPVLDLFANAVPVTTSIHLSDWSA